MFVDEIQKRAYRAITVALASACWLALSGCATPVNPPGGNGDGNTTVLFSTQIQPILTSNGCSGCHSVGGIADLDGIALRLTAQESFAGLVNQNSVQDTSLIIVVPGDSASSLLVEKIESSNPAVGARMPLFGPALTQAEIDLIKNWIDQGAMNN